MIADELARKHVPFAFPTGYGSDIIPDRFQSAVEIEKPYDVENIVEVITRLVERQNLR